MTFGERLTELRKEKGFNRTSFANYIGIPGTTLRNYETDVREPGHIFLKHMADIFKVSTDYLLCITDDRTPSVVRAEFTLDEIGHIKNYRALDESGRRIVNAVIDEITREAREDDAEKLEEITPPTPK